MTTELQTGPPTTRPAPGTAMPGERILGLRCRNCGRPEPIGPSYVCAACFGPLEVAYDLDVVRGLLDRATIAARPAGIWRYLELLPVTARPARGLAVGSTPLIAADRLGPTLGIDRLWLKDDTRNPTLSFKDRGVALGAARAVEFGMPALACASTGNLAGAVAAAAAAIGLPAFVFIPADLEPAKIEHALAYGATVVPVDGTYDDVNRLCLEVADELGWGFVNINLRPYYAEGSKTLAFELAEALGWRLPDVVVGPIASGALFTKLAKGFDELARIGLIERDAGPVRRRPGGRLRAGRDGVRQRHGRHRAGSRPGYDRPLAGDREPGRRPLLGRARPGERRLDRGDPGRRHGGRDPTGRPARGDLSRDGRRGHPRGGRSRSPARGHPARRRGRRAPDGERAQDARRGPFRGRDEPGATGAARPRADHPRPLRGLRRLAGVVSIVRIPPVLRAATGGQKQVEVAGATVREVIDGLVAAHPGLAGQLLAEDGDLNRFVNVFLNDTDVRHLQALDTPVEPRDTVLLLPAMAGGADCPSGQIA